MDAERRSTRIAALIAAAAIAVLALAMISASRASAEDTFRFDNETGEGFTGMGRDTVPECWSGASGVLAPQTEPRQSGRISADISPFESCGEFFGVVLSYNQTFWEDYEMEGEPGALWKGGVGGFNFAAEDPVVDPATLGCSAAGQEWAEAGGAEPIENKMSSEVDGTTCTVSWLPGAKPGRLARASALTPSDAKYSRFVSSLAPVTGGAAHVLVQTFARSKLRVGDEIVLRTRAGQPIGQARAELRVGAKARRVPVPLASAARQALHRQHYLVVKATLRHADGSAGSGDTTAQMVLRQRAPSQ